MSYIAKGDSMEIGELLKIERKKRNLTQREFSETIMTPSYYAKIEKDQHQITVNLLLELLEANQIDSNDFFNQLKTGNSNFIQKQQIEANISKSTINGDINSLQKIKEEVNTNNYLSLDEKMNYSSIIELYQLDIEDRVEDLSDDSKDTLLNRVFNLSSWNTGLKLSLYSQTIQLYDIETNILLINSILSKSIKTYTSQNQFFILVILSNFISKCIAEDYYKYANEYITLIEAQPTSTENFFIKLITSYHHLLLDKKRGLTININNLESLYTVLSICDMNSFSQKLRAEFNNQTEN